ncbi:MAG: tRNA 2-thiouridine(34) synthase MnmA [Verrucomicrobiales bacterium]|nr:tRNA 2-thiouridine(34) synthase MnmA [Verrucomicrobiales bacterium]
MAKILVGMSGGVDSSVAAGLLLEQGHEVVGAYMRNFTNEEGLPGDCPWEQDIRDARAVCDHLGIEFRILSLEEEYRERVVDYLLAGYKNGVTPNPDVMCNREMKFGIFLEFAKAQGFEHVATGHYARVRRNDDGTSDILKGLDPNKDQTYFLALLEQHQIQPAWFPIGEIAKPDVRQEAERMGIPVAQKKDSQGICFIGDIKMSDFLAHYIPDNPGPIVTLDGRELGQHRGLHLHTLGQRKGLGVASNTHGKAYVVVEKRPETNELVIAFDEPNTPKLYATECRVGSISVTNGDLRGMDNLSAQPRYRSAAVPVSIDQGSFDEPTLLVRFAESQRALTPGQICAFYRGDVLVGGGVFQEILYSA